MKRKACAEVGIKSFDVNLPEQVPEAELISKVHELNEHPDVHGWLPCLRSDFMKFLFIYYFAMFQPVWCEGFGKKNIRNGEKPDSLLCSDNKIDRKW